MLQKYVGSVLILFLISMAAWMAISSFPRNIRSILIEPSLKGDDPFVMNVVEMTEYGTTRRFQIVVQKHSENKLLITQDNKSWLVSTQ